MFTDIIILAGGAGTRLKPLSDEKAPKQFIKPNGKESFFQQTLQRAVSLHCSNKIHIITRKIWINIVLQEIEELTKQKKYQNLSQMITILAEPEGKNTAPALFWISQILINEKHTIPPNMLILPGDHIIENDNSFTNCIKAAEFCSSNNFLVTIGITPKIAETGYGYIKTGELYKQFGSTSAHYIKEFKEKPNEKTAKQYVKEGSYVWNSGIYACRADFFISEIEKHTPEIAEGFCSLENEFEKNMHNGITLITDQKGLKSAYKKTPSISIDYALSEKTEKSIVIPGSFFWDDVGSWESLEKYLSTEESNSECIESSNCFVHSDIPVAICGIDDLIIVIKNGRALIAKRGESHLVQKATFFEPRS